MESYLALYEDHCNSSNIECYTIIKYLNSFFQTKTWFSTISSTRNSNLGLFLDRCFDRSDRSFDRLLNRPVKSIVSNMYFKNSCLWSVDSAEFESEVRFGLKPNV
mgnify:CR=1 FL=1